MDSELSSETSLPLVSVIIPTYNYAHLIAQTLENIQAQTYRNWECIVVDDGSMDNTEELIAHYLKQDNRIKYIYQKNQGQAAARNNGIKSSAGKYLQFLDADDLIEAKKFERQVEYLERYPDVDIVYSNVRYFRTERMNERLYSMWGDNSPWMPEISGRGEDILLALSGGNIMVVNAPLIRRNIIDDVGLFDETVPPLEDWDYWIRCAIHGKWFQYKDFEGTRALVRSHSLSSSRNRQHMKAANSLIQEKLLNTKTSTRMRKINLGIAAQIEGWMGIEEVTSGSLIKGIMHLFKAGMMGGKMKWRIKWFLSGLMAPFAPRQEFRKFASFSIMQSAASLLHRLKQSH